MLLKVNNNIHTEKIMVNYDTKYCNISSVKNMWLIKTTNWFKKSDNKFNNILV